jgi:hypothetical protein
MEKDRKRVNLAVKNIVLGVEGYVIKHNNMRARDINLFRNDGTPLSDIGINVYLNTIQGALESFLSSEFLPLIYPPELEVKETTDTASSASFLDLCLEFDDSGLLSTKIYDKRDDFNFKIINFPEIE